MILHLLDQVSSIINSTKCTDNHIDLYNYFKNVWLFCFIYKWLQYYKIYASLNNSCNYSYIFGVPKCLLSYLFIYFSIEIIDRYLIRWTPILDYQRSIILFDKKAHNTNIIVFIIMFFNNYTNCFLFKVKQKKTLWPIVMSQVFALKNTFYINHFTSKSV